jgi:putative ABC transport system permease protein
MKLFNVLLTRLRALLRRESVIEDIEREMRSHLQMEIATNIGRGMSPEDARVAALRSFGNPGRARDLAYDVRGGGVLEVLWQDLRYGLRTLLRKPGFTLTVVVTLGLGIGANSAIFSVVNGILLRPLEYRDPDRIVTLLDKGRGPVSPANFIDFSSQCDSFTEMAAAEAWGGTLVSNGHPESVQALRMGEGLFSLLGVEPLLGRTLQPDDFQPGQDRVLVLSHKLWIRAFGGDPAVIGQVVTFSGEPFSVVGVMPPQFHFPPFWSTRAELWAPLDLRNRATSRGGNSLRVFARLRPDATLEQAQGEIDTLNTRLAAAYPDANAGLNIRVDPLNEKVVGTVRPALLVLCGAVGFVLLIACANVACLLLARAAARQQETAVRVALGASRGRIIRQLLTESLLLSIGGAIVGIVLAFGGVEMLKGLLAGNTSSFSVRLPRLNEVSVDTTTLIFTLVISLLTGLLFGLVPALGASTSALNRVRGASGGRRRLREMLVVAELALALVTLMGAGLLMNSFLKLAAVDPGFEPGGVLTMSTSVEGLPHYVGPRRDAFYQQLTDRLRALPGVESVSAINHLPLAGDTWGVPLTIQGRPLPSPGEGLSATFRVCRPDYFRTMGIPLIAGRDFTEQDTRDAPGVIILNERLARQNWPGEDPIGKQVTLDDPRSTSPVAQWLTVVGVVKNVKQDSWTEQPSNEIYLAFQQSRGFFESPSRRYSSMTIVLRAAVDPGGLAAAARETVRSLDSGLPVSNVVTMEQVIADKLWQERFNLQLIGLFGGVALVMAAVGLYGVMSYSVNQRTQEVGVRMALGAQRGDVVKLIIGDGMRLCLLGLAAGLAGSLALTRVMSRLLFEVSSTDPATFGLIAGLLAAVALVACYIPARRAARVDPLVALRYE